VLHRPEAEEGRGKAGTPRYLAYVLRRGGEVAWVELGDAAAIDGLVDRLRRDLSAPTRDHTPAARALGERVWRPIRERLGGARWVLLSPDGVLALVPFEVMMDAGRHAIERHAFTYLTTGRELLRAAAPAAPGGAPLVVAAADFGARDPGTAPIAAADSPRPAPGPGLRAARAAGLRFPPLPGTEAEGRAIHAALDGGRLLLGSEATEQAVKAARGPRILHLATHGFFLPGSWLAPRGAGALSDVENPLLRSGLAFAGANGLRSGSEDGLLTALELSTLDLRGTRLAVLSACETGLGQAERGEGVYGLRRALAIAGAETQVISLWRVDDAATRALMVAYYGHLRRGGGRAESLRRTQLEMLARRETSHPFYWAGFIVSGNPAAIDGAPVAPRFDDAPPARPPAAAPGARGCGCAAAGAERAGEWLWVGAAIAGAGGARRRRQLQRPPGAVSLQSSPPVDCDAWPSPSASTPSTPSQF
jgi:MYXO-CTERM domain-containing protein